jgi:hypothetical protein
MCKARILLLAGAIFLGAAVMPERSLGSYYSVAPIGESFEKATSVVSIVIRRVSRVGVGGEECGVKYEGEIINVFKGSTLKTGQAITFGRDLSLLYGHQYILFLNNYQNAQEYYQHIKKDAGFDRSFDESLSAIICGGIIPGYIYNQDLAWEILDQEVYMHEKLPSSIGTVLHVLKKNEQNWVVRKKDLLDYFSTLN